jgi:ribosomal-protein-alanine N-acetyltransferase
MEQSFPKEIDDLVESVTLEVRVSNKPATELYLKNGYKIVVVKSKYYKDGEDAIYMVKRL